MCVCVARAANARARASVPFPPLVFTLALSLSQFYPLKFRGVGRFGWQGIVPSKRKSMANSIVDDVMLRLIDLRTVFARLDADAVAAELYPAVRKVADELARDLDARKRWGPLAASVVAPDSAAIMSGVSPSSVARSTSAPFDRIHFICFTFEWAAAWCSKPQPDPSCFLGSCWVLIEEPLLTRNSQVFASFSAFLNKSSADASPARSIAVKIKK